MRIQFKNIVRLLVLLFITFQFYFLRNQWCKHLSPRHASYIPVDWVILWVNGSDPQWQRDLERYIESYRLSVFTSIGKKSIRQIPYLPDAFHRSRFTDNGELRFALRSIETNAPWVHRIYIVTNGQRPAWLNRTNPRVRVVSHRMLFKNSSSLPTFNSNAIERTVHRIPGLSRHYIMSNDDILLTAPTTLTDFYSATSGPLIRLGSTVMKCRDFCRGQDVYSGVCNEECNHLRCDLNNDDCPLTLSHRMYSILRFRNTFDVSLLLSDQLLTRTFGFQRRRITSHVPYMVDREAAYRLERQFPNETRDTEARRFRHPLDLQSAFVYAHFFMSEQNSYTADTTCTKYKVMSDGEASLISVTSNEKENRKRFLELLQDDLPKFLCINDDIDDNTSKVVVARIKMTMISFMYLLFPRPSEFEVENLDIHVNRK